ncbi:MAG: hypothetical protein P8X88_02680 [Gammaproteobacteria bacterium]
MQFLYKLVITVFTLVSIFVSGCTSTDPTRVEADYGNSVRNMVEAQIYDPDAANYPPSEPPTTLDGNYAVEVLEAYRDDVSRPEEVRRPIKIEIAE